MKINEILDAVFVSQSLLETVDGKNLHLEHLDDEVWNRGYQGAVEAIDYLEGATALLQGTSNQRYFATKKWDGSPALIMGTDPETGQFVMGDKGIFSSTKENRIYSTNDIGRVKPDKRVGDKTVDRSDLREKLKVAFNYLKDLNFGDKILQGDLLWTANDGTSGFKDIDGQSYFTFTPNLLTYAVPAGPLADRMSQSKVGIVFHTTYEGGPTLQDMTARFGADVSDLGTSPNVWYRDAAIKDVTGSVTMTKEESLDLQQSVIEMRSFLKGIGTDTFAFLEGSLAGHNVRDLIKADMNVMVRAGGFENPGAYVPKFIQRLEQRLDADIQKLKTEKGQERKAAEKQAALKYVQQHHEAIENVYFLFLGIQIAKDKLQKHYSTVKQIDTFIERPDGSFEVKPEEGVVIVDHLGKGGKEAVKIVDRLDFSRENFGKVRA